MVGVGILSSCDRNPHGIVIKL